MSHSTPEHSAKRPPDDDPEPLSLAEENEGSTDPVGGGESSSSTSSKKKSSPDGGSGSSRSPEASSGSSSTATGQTSTGGFETMLGKLVVTSGLVTPDEIELCNSLLRESQSEDSESSSTPRTLADLLIENEFLTPRQLERMRGDFEAKKSSQRIPGYKIIKKLGSGAMATVFLAKQISLDRHVAVKVLPKKFSDNKKFIERFYKEGRAAAQLNHPNIVGAYDVGNAGEHHYFVMEYVDGETVYDCVAAHKRMAEKDAIEIIRQTAEALKHAHEKGFIHRDIKPKNIMIKKNGVVKLADLGLARAMTDVQAAKAEAGRAYGTPYYISPEQIRGEVRIGPPADIYGLGATFYHMVTGRVPFEGKNPSAVMHKHLKNELTPPDHLNPKLSAGCAQVIEMMLAKSSKARYQNAGDLLEDLALIAKGETPHYANKGLGMSGVSTQIIESAPKTSSTITTAAATSGKQEASPINMLLLVLLVISLVANGLLVLLLVLN